MRHLAEVLSRAENARQPLAALHSDDLYLACACARGDPKAIADCDARAVPEIVRTLRRMDLAQTTVDEALQTLRARLFAAAPGARPQIASYSGRARLAGWMRVVAVRDALQLLRAERRVRLVDEEDLAELVEPGVAPGAGVEREHMKLLYGAEFQRAFRQAVAALPRRDQELLRAHFLEGRSIDELGERFHVHRATAARWIERARRALTVEIRRAMMRELQVDRATYQSVLRLVLSRADLSLRLVLGGEEAPQP